MSLQRRLHRYGSKIPFVPTPQPVVRRMLELAEVKVGDLVYDLGAGDGRILVEAVKRFGAKAVGVEIDPLKVEAVKKRTLHLKDITIFRGDFFDADLSQADVVTLYLLPEVNLMLRHKLMNELKAGSKIICHDYPIPYWKPKEVERFVDGGHRHTLYLYTIKRRTKKEPSCR